MTSARNEQTLSPDEDDRAAPGETPVEGEGAPTCPEPASGHPAKVEDSSDGVYVSDGPVEHNEYVEDGEPGESDQVIITEALGPKLSRRSVLLASGVVVALALGTGVLAGGIGDQARGVEVSSLTNTSTTEAAPMDSSGVAELAAESVYKVEVGNQVGSSFLIEPNTLMTNAHVAAVDVGEAISVTGPGREEIEGTVLMKDPGVDIALIEVPDQDADPLPLVEVGEQAAGQPVSLIGYPLGLEVSVTTGAASAIDTVTSLRESSGQHSLLQIDAAVNPGSSGGPVLDSRGRVMGMATSRPDLVGDRPVHGIAFAVPSDDLTVAVRQYSQHGDVAYGYLGVSMDTSASGGALVESVTANSPAEGVGLEEGDVIASVSEHPTPTYAEASRVLHMFRPGEEVQLSVETDGDTRTVNVVLGESSR